MINVNDVPVLYADTKKLYDTIIIGSNAWSADTIIANLVSGIENLKNNWKGVDAGVRIQEVIEIHNTMVAVRNALAELAKESSKVPADLRSRQSANMGGGLEEFPPINCDLKTYIEAYTDTSNTVFVQEGLRDGANYIKTASDNLEQFKESVSKTYSDIMENWKSGPGRDVAEEAFTIFLKNVDDYKTELAAVSNNINIVCDNWGV